MSLIVDINPVPWKILDLVRARILKNRAKKAKKGTDWSKEKLKREMRMQLAPLISRRRDEPSFTASGRFVTYTIEGIRRYYTITGAAATEFLTWGGTENPTPPTPSAFKNKKQILDLWTVFVNWEDRKKQTDDEEKQLILKVVTPLRDSGWNLDWLGPNVDTLYISRFEDLGTGGEGAPLFILSTAITTTERNSQLGRDAEAFSIKEPFDLDNFALTDYNLFDKFDFTFNAQATYLTVATTFAHPSIAWGYEAAIMSTMFNPLQAWTLAPYVEPSPDSKNSSAASTASNPLANEYDISKIKDAPGYIGTDSLSFPDGGCPTGLIDSGVIYEMYVITFPYAASSGIARTTIMYATSPPQVTQGANWSVTWTSLWGEQFGRYRADYPPDSVWVEYGNNNPPYVILQYVKQVGTIKDCKISKIIEP